MPHPLRAHRRTTPFARLTLSNLAAQMSDQVALIALPMAAVTLLDAGGGATSLMQALNTLPYLLLAIPIGLLVDRGRRIGVMAAAELVRALSIVGLLLLAQQNTITLVSLAILGMIGSIGTLAYTVAVPTVVKDLVPRAKLTHANGQIELARSVATTAGPALGGALVGYIGANAAFGLATALSLVALLNVLALPRPADGAVLRKSHPLRDIQEGARFVLRHDLLRPIVMTAVLFNTGWFCLQGAYIAYAMNRLGMTSAQTGITLTIYGLGMVIGARLSGRLSRRYAFGTLIVVGPACGAFASLLMLATLVWPSWILPSLAYLLLGAGPMIWTISTTTLRQVVTPPEMLGRVTALTVTSTAGFRPVGAGLGALAYVAGGYQTVLAASCIAFLAQLIVIARSKAATLDHLPSIGAAPVAVH